MLIKMHEEMKSYGKQPTSSHSPFPNTPSKGELLTFKNPSILWLNQTDTVKESTGLLAK